VSADVRILGNPLLTDLDELGNLISVGNDIFVDSNEALAQCSGLIPLLDAVDDGEPGPGPGPGGVPDVGSEIFLQDNLVGCNSIEEILNANAQAELDLTKISATKLVTQAGQIVHYDYEIINTSQVTLHDVSVTDDNVDATPVCAFAGNDELAPAGNFGSTVHCTAQHTVTPQEIAAEGTLDNTATATSDEAQPVTASLGIPIGISLDGFEELSCPCFDEFKIGSLFSQLTNDLTPGLVVEEGEYQCLFGQCNGCSGSITPTADPVRNTCSVFTSPDYENEPFKIVPRINITAEEAQACVNILLNHCK